MTEELFVVKHETSIMGASLTKAQADNLIASNREVAKRTKNESHKLLKGWSVEPETQAMRDQRAKDFKSLVKTFQ